MPADGTVIFDLGESGAETGGLGDTDPAAPPTAAPPVAAPEPVAEPAAGAEATPEPPVDLVPVGSRVSATLITGIVVSQGASVPVVLETSGAWCQDGSCPEITWIGRATLDASERVQVTLTQAVVDNSVRTVTGVVLNPDFTVGLTAEIRDESPSFAEDLVRSSLGGVSDYVEALTQQQKVTIVDGTVVAESEVPAVDNFILGRVTSLFDVPPSDEPTVRVAQVAASTPVVILYGVTN